MGEAQLGLGSLSLGLRPPRLLLTPLTLPPPHVVRLGGGFGRVRSVGEVVEVIPGHKGGHYTAAASAATRLTSRARRRSPRCSSSRTRGTSG